MVFKALSISQLKTMIHERQKTKEVSPTVFPVHHLEIVCRLCCREKEPRQNVMNFLGRGTKMRLQRNQGSQDL